MSESISENTETTESETHLREGIKSADFPRIDGYDFFLENKQGEIFEVWDTDCVNPVLSLGQIVKVKYDEQGYNQSGLKEGEQVIIVGFSKPLQAGRIKDFIIVSRVGMQEKRYVKPSNIQKL